MTSRLPWPDSEPEPDHGHGHGHGHGHEAGHDGNTGTSSGETAIVIVGLAARETVGRVPDGVAAFFGDAVHGASRERLGALQLVWGALEDAGIVPGALCGADVGVFLVAAAAEPGDRDGDGVVGGSDGLAVLVGGDLGWGRGG
ncbi:hypothetical protein F9278_02705 [Streptomyces phaeolivaceus]|uniref:Uncharacterized protein n=1 Tax=Streptomyces phaeolivaceus TaxID=2653200 RepID=A0A5P8JX76_9ACTN|nr:hypothetical protein [Streptomyces phaeolivaceus]QFQ95280.1 hypothetical protein F9278_02705 [Streptomyces phaeolivaceus]